MYFSSQLRESRLVGNDLQATMKICIHRLNVKVGATIPTGCFIIKSEGKSMCNGQKSVDCKNFRPRLSLVSGFLTLEWFQDWKPRPLLDNELDFTRFIFNAFENVSKILISHLTLDDSHAGLDS
jgi:hypothetical protein